VSQDGIVVPSDDANLFMPATTSAGILQERGRVYGVDCRES
jgi:hypothetical protein